MEKILNRRIEEHTTQFNDAIKEKLTSLNICGNRDRNTVLEFICNYKRLVLDKKEIGRASCRERV